MLRQAITLLLTIGIFISTSLSAGEVRHCDAGLGWETTGGNFKGGIIEFKGAGTCPGKAKANKCRENARKAIERCVRTQYEKRWEHHPFNSDGSPSPDFDRTPPEACLQAANIEGYSLEKNCWTKRKDGKNSVRVCHNESGSEKNVPGYISDVVKVSTAGDIKRALETSVCCFRENGLHPFPDDENVHVRLIANSSSGNDPQKKCNMRLELSDDYKINCKRIREQLCH